MHLYGKNKLKRTLGLIRTFLPLMSGFASLIMNKAIGEIPSVIGGGGGGGIITGDVIDGGGVIKIKNIIA